MSAQIPVRHVTVQEPVDVLHAIPQATSLEALAIIVRVTVLRVLEALATAQPVRLKCLWHQMVAILLACIPSIFLNQEE